MVSLFLGQFKWSWFFELEKTGSAFGVTKVLYHYSFTLLPGYYATVRILSEKLIFLSTFDA